jgi:hypothetical protein
MVGVQVTVYRGEGGEAVGYETNTDEAGRFEFVNLAPGTWKVCVDPDGYIPFNTDETVLAEQATDVVCYVESVAYNFDFSDSQPTTGLPIIPALGIKAEF